MESELKIIKHKSINEKGVGVATLNQKSTYTKIIEEKKKNEQKEGLTKIEKNATMYNDEKEQFNEENN